VSILARVLGKILSDQEHDFLVGWLLNKCCLHAFKQNGYVIYGLVLKNMMKNIYFVFMRNVDKTLMILWFVFWKCFDSSIKWFWEQKDGSYAFEMKKIGN
jgi:hypothetical protein